MNSTSDVNGSSIGSPPLQDAQPKVMSVSQLLRRLFPYLTRYNSDLVTMFVTLVVDQAYGVAFPLSLKFLIDRAITPQDQHAFLIIMGILFIGVVLSSIAKVVRDGVYARLGAFVVNDIRVDMFGHLQRLPMSFHARSQIGDLMTRFSTDLTVVETVITSTMAVFARNFLALLLSVIALAFFDWKLTLLSLLILPLSFIGTLLLKNRVASAGAQMNHEVAQVASVLQENLVTQPVIKAFGLQEHVASDFRRRADSLSGISSRANFLANTMHRCPELGTQFFLFLVIGVGAWMALSGKLSVGDLIACQALLLNLSDALYGVASTIPEFMRATVGMQRIYEVLDEIPHVSDAPDAMPMAAPKKEIEFHHVTFGYTPEQPNLNDVSIRIPIGSKTAFVGSSGSGKSTILNLVLRFYDADAGSVTIDGVDICSVTQDSLRSHMAVVFQEAFLFNMSIRENIRISRVDATEAEVEAAARAAEIHEIIMALPQGYDTLAGERGSRFSGGQRQRISIARALLRNPEILILDEATSALDPATEEAINETLLRIAEGRTMLSVTHRLHSVADYDWIVVMHQGRVVEQGHHDDLLAHSGMYSELWNKQHGFSISDDGSEARAAPARLADIPILSKLDASLLADLVGDFNSERFPPDREVIVEGDPADKFYIIVRGQVLVTRRMPDGTIQKLTTLQDGDFLGEVALLNDVQRTATVRTLSNTMFLTLTRDKFNRLLSRAPHLRQELEKDYPI